MIGTRDIVKNCRPQGGFAIIAHVQNGLRKKKNILKDCLLSIFLRRRVTSVTFVGPGGWNWHAEFKFLWNSFILTDTLPIFEQMIKYFLFFNSENFPSKLSEF